MVPNSKGITTKIKKTEKENFTGPMEIYTQGILGTISAKEKGP